MRDLVAWMLGFGLAANGLIMLGFPGRLVRLGAGRCRQTGPFNPHFIRDIGAAYLVAGTAFVWFATDRAREPAALAGAAFLALHALIHLWDAAAGREHGPSLAHRSADSLSAAGAGDLDRLVAAAPRSLAATKGEHK